MDQGSDHGPLARYLHHFGDYADRAALDVLNKTAPKALTKRARKLPDLSSFGAGADSGRTASHSRGLSR
ncbi:hypothetical protein [Microbacterium luticocti]|uniref:hypothetical protein n=1 Tax=Microbacterium luticocti TaxID=451764 RepID=UPI0003F63A8D|nr:hypothetical protein [Microbacterium luticocti]